MFCGRVIKKKKRGDEKGRGDYGIGKKGTREEWGLSEDHGEIGGGLLGRKPKEQRKKRQKTLTTEEPNLRRVE